MNLESITGNLAKKHNLSKEDYLDKDVLSVYPTREDMNFEFFDDGLDRVDNQVLIAKSGTLTYLNNNLKSFVKFMEEINHFLKKENFELIYKRVISDEGKNTQDSDMYLTLIDNIQRDIKGLKKTPSKTDITLYSGGQIGSCLDSMWFSSEEDNPKLKEVFNAIKIGYKDICNSR